MRYTVSAAARAAGVSPGRLRSWERRHGVPAPARSGTGRRLYTADEVALIRRMSALIGSGVSVAEAAEAALAGAPTPLTPTVAAASAHQLAHAVNDAARDLDGRAAQAALEEAVRTLGWGRTLDEVIFPALRTVGEHWQDGSLTPAHEHFISELIRLELLVASASQPPLPLAPLVLLACPEDERHDLGLLALRLLLGERGMRVLYLGVDLPAEALVAAVRDARPAAVVLAGTVSNSAPALELSARAVASSDHRSLLFLGGPALEGNDRPLPGIQLPPGLGSAAALITAAISNRKEDSR